MIELEDQKLTDQRSRLTAMKRETRMKELRSLEEARQRYLDQQQRIRENEIRKMDREIQRKVRIRWLEVENHTVYILDTYMQLNHDYLNNL